MRKNAKVTIDYARTPEDADRFNGLGVARAPYNLRFKVKPKDKQLK